MAQSRVRAASRSFNLPNGDDGEADKAAITERTTTDIAKGGARPCYQTGTKHQVKDGRHDTTAVPQIQLFASKIGGTTQPRRSTSVPFRYVPKARMRCYQSVTTSYRHERRTSFPSLGDTSAALVVFVLCQTSALAKPGVGDPVSPAGNC